MSSKQKPTADNLFHGLVTQGSDGCSVLRVVHFDVTAEGVSFLQHNGEGLELLPFDHMRVRRSGCGRRGTAFQGKAQFPILYVKDLLSIEAILQKAPSRVQKQLVSLMREQRTLRTSLRFAAGGIVMMLAMLWAIPSL